MNGMIMYASIGRYISYILPLLFLFIVYHVQSLCSIQGEHYEENVEQAL